MGELRPGTVIAGKYRLERPLSKGGMGSVWLADHLHLEAPVAVKFMRSSLVTDSVARSRFEREAKAAAQLRSPFVVHVYDHGLHDGSPFIVMEYLEGSDLRGHLRGAARCPRARRYGSVSRSARACNVPTLRASCIATSSPGTSSCRRPTTGW